MKYLYILLFYILILSSCNQNKKHPFNKLITVNKKLKDTKKLDTIFNYWEPIIDTILVKKEFTFKNKEYLLELKTFSLNDSAIVRTLDNQNNSIYLDHSHTMVSNFKLFSDSIPDSRTIDKSFFKKSLLKDFYVQCNLLSTKIDSISNHQVYLTSDLAIPDTDNQWRVWYSIQIINNKIDSLNIKSTDYVGL